MSATVTIAASPVPLGSSSPRPEVEARARVKQAKKTTRRGTARGSILVNPREGSNRGGLPIQITRGNRLAAITGDQGIPQLTVHRAGKVADRTVGESDVDPALVIGSGVDSHSPGIRPLIARGGSHVELATGPPSDV